MNTDIKQQQMEITYTIKKREALIIMAIFFIIIVFLSIQYSILFFTATTGFLAAFKLFAITESVVYKKKAK